MFIMSMKMPIFVKMNENMIIHVDMDAFFASVEQRDNPGLRGKPVAVGFDGPRGVVSTASYEARKFGVHSAMPISKAKRLCSQLIVVPSRFDIYKEVSHQIHEIFMEYTDCIEPLSIDEAFLDVTSLSVGFESVRETALEIKNKIKERTQLTASAGVSYNKFLAKIASDYNKPDGLFVIPPDKAIEFIDQLPIEDFWGVGPKTADKMHKMGIFNGAQLRGLSLKHLNDVFGKSGQIYYNFARGIDDRKVITERERKSVGCEQTFLEDISLKSTVIIELYHTVLELEERVSRAGFEGKTLTLKVKYFDFTQISRSLTCNRILKTKADILPVAKKLLNQVDFSADKPIRLIGLSISNPSDGDVQILPKWTEGYLPFEK
jgi:DNA polymerase-4